MDEIAANAKMARTRAGFETQDAAAKAIGCARTLVLAWEAGTAALKGSKYLLDAAKAYRVRPEWLADGDAPDGYPWNASATERPQRVIPDFQTDVALALEALGRSQAYIAQALAATIPTAAREILASLDSRLPEELREVAYIKTLRTAIVGQLASNDKLAMHAPAQKAHSVPRRKRP